MFNYNTFQKEVHEWSIKNFGPNTATQKLCGIIEEYGELLESLEGSPIDKMMMQDAIGDIFVYAADYTAILGIEMESVVWYVPEESEARNMMQIFAKLCHHTLKFEQRIRGNEDHKKEIVNLLGQLFSTLYSLTEVYTVDSIDEIVEATWDEVSQRDWTKNSVNGEVRENG